MYQEKSPKTQKTTIQGGKITEAIIANGAGTRIVEMLIWDYYFPRLSTESCFFSPKLWVRRTDKTNVL